MFVCPLNVHLHHPVVFKEAAARCSGDLCVKLPNNNVAPSEWEHPVHAKVRIILSCLICMQNVRLQAIESNVARQHAALRGGKTLWQGGIQMGLVGSSHLAFTVKRGCNLFQRSVALQPAPPLAPYSIFSRRR